MAVPEFNIPATDITELLSVVDDGVFCVSQVFGPDDLRHKINGALLSVVL
jgi:hypothetical protein